MSLVHDIHDLLTRSFEGSAWHGPSLAETLDTIDAERAAAKPIPSAHSIWEIALHIAAWEGVVVRRLAGEAVTEPAEGDFPEIGDTSGAGWAAAKEHVAKRNRALRQAVLELSDADLATPPPNNQTPRFVALTGILQHLIYHTGQIAVLAKAT